MRLILLPHPAAPDGHGTEVEIEAGRSIGELRPHLARLTGDRRWATDVLAVGDRSVADSHTAGHPPLVSAAVLRIGRGEPDTALAAVRAPRHVAVLSGPRAGELVAVGAVPTDVGGRPVRQRRGGVVVGRGFASRRWRVGHRRPWGGSTYELRTSAAQPPSERDVNPGTWLAPLGGAAALAVVVHQPAFLLVALAAPVATVLPRLVRNLRGRRTPTSAARSSATAGPVEHVADVAAVAARSAVATQRQAAPAVIDAPWGSDGSWALVGPRAVTVPHARAVVIGTTGSHGSVDVVALGDHASAWSWCAASRADLPRPDDAPGLVVVDGATDLTRVAAWRRSAPGHHRLLLLVDTPDAVPAWCTAWTAVDAVPVHPLAADIAARQWHRAACLRATSRAAGVVPDVVDLGTLPGVPRAESGEIRAAWTHAARTPAAPLGRGAGQVVELDLVRDGPHVLVGGTTGAGKSELLVTLVLGQALRQPPHRLAVLLVDYKGGTGLGPVAGLPHVVDHVTDLDPAAAARLLDALRAELRRRERLLSQRHVRDLGDLDPDDGGTPPRLLVVVDELRALVDDVPDAAPALARLAAQGRALGIHLVLATQRPAGAVGADLRANIGLRIALRLRDAADSADLVDAADAAHLRSDRPGRAVVRAGSGPLVHVQVARSTVGARRPPVRPASVVPTGLLPRAWTPPAPPPDDDATAWAGAATAAADSLPQPFRRPSIPWLPALPTTVGARELDAVHADAAAGFAFALGDEPERQRRTVRRWAPDDGHLLLVGARRSGRSTALVTVGLTALRAGREVHAIGLPDEARRQLEESAAPTLGSIVALDQPRLVARLLELLAAGPPPDLRPVVLVDGLDVALDVLADVARGAGTRRLTDLWRGGTPPVALAATCDPRHAGTHAAAFSHRVVLAVPDPTTDLLLGVPRTLSLPRTVPGRAVHLHGSTAVLCQVALPGPPDADAACPAAPPHDETARRPPRVRALPTRAVRPERDISSDRTLAVGVGGDEATELAVAADEGLLVCGPPGSGRSTAVRSVARAAAAAGHRVLVVRPPRAAPTPGAPQADRPVGTLVVQVVDTPDDVALDALVPMLERRPRGPHDGSDDPPIVVVDDLDDLEHRDPELAERLLDLATTGRATLVAAATAHAASTAFRGLLPWLLRRQSVLVLDPGEPACAQLVGPEAPWLTDAGRVAGRGVLVVGRRTVPVQVYDDPPRDVATDAPVRSGRSA